MENSSHQAAANDAAEKIPRLDAIIVGAGFAGMYMLYKLRQIGLSVRVFESGSDVGGTWYWNRYPGARCDVPSTDYSYSFSDELQQEWNWTEMFAAQPEILEYLNHVADKFDLRRDMRFDSRVISATFDDDASYWTVVTDRNERVHARYCIMATGCLSTPKSPEIEGLETFAGETYYTARWPHREVDFSARRLGVIGTGSTGIQVIPVVAQQAAHLYVFQRTPSFTVPARNRPLDAQYMADVKSRYKELRAKARLTPSGSLRPITDRPAFSVSEEERQRIYNDVWEKGGVNFFSSFGDLLLNEDANKTAADFVRSKIEELVEDPDVANRLKPYGYPFASRRLCLDTDYYATFNRNNVTLVDTLADPIVAITPRGVKTRDREFNLDALIFATGFDAMTGTLLAIDIRGRNGRLLREKWAHGPRTMLGVAMEGFPNLFTITGPGSPSVLSNVVASIEQHVEWITDCITHMQQAGYVQIEPTAEAENGWVDHVNAVADATLFPKANSWYMGANVPGKPRVFMPYVGGLHNFRRICAEIAAKGYDGFRLTASGSSFRATASIGDKVTPSA
jgi:cyclohexanone monooxygenase